MKLVGLTGGIASGKSTVGRLLQTMGLPVVDSDQIAREVVMPGTPGLAVIRQAFGEAVLQSDGSLDRKALGAIVFSDPIKRRLLDGILHPLIRARAVEAFVSLEMQGHKVVVYEVPLLFETGLHTAMDAVILVALPKDLQAKRLVERDGLNPEEAEARIRSQMSLDEKRKLASHVIENDSDKAALEAKTKALWQELSSSFGLA